MIKITELIFFVSIFVSCVFAQNDEVTRSFQIVSVNTDAFYNEDSGIPEFVKVLKQLEIELKSEIEEYDILSATLTKLIEEQGEKPYFYHCYNNSSKEVEKIVKLNEDLKLKQTKLKGLYLTRKAELTKDLTKKVSQALKAFAKENKYPIVLDSSKENSSAIVQGEIIDVTKEFIQFYNERFTNEKSQ